jgi:hypothetical protein
MVFDCNARAPSDDSFVSAIHDPDFEIQVSTKFFSGATMLASAGVPIDTNIQADTILVSSDSVFFYTHSRVLLKRSNNSFNNLIPLSSPSSLVTPPLQDDWHSYSDLLPLDTGPDTHSDFPMWNQLDMADMPSLSPINSLDPACHQTGILPLTENSSVINVLLHTIYGIDCKEYSPTLDILISTVRSLNKYGYNAREFLHAPTLVLDQEGLLTDKPSLYDLFIPHARQSPMEVYAFAASLDLEDLAKATSVHLLSLALYNLTDDQCAGMGPIYLRRLFFLHLGRIEALKVRKLFSVPPFLTQSIMSSRNYSSFHPPTTSLQRSAKNRIRAT